VNYAQNSVDYFVTLSKVHNTISYAGPLSIDFVVAVSEVHSTDSKIQVPSKVQSTLVQYVA